MRPCPPNRTAPDARSARRPTSPGGPRKKPWASRARFRSPVASSRRCIAAASGRCGNTRGSEPPRESNQRYRYLLAQGVSGLSVAFDLPTQMGYDSDHPLAAGEVGRVGVAIDSIEDMSELLDGLPLGQVTTSMTINATAIDPAVALRGGGATPGRGARGTRRHGAERHPEGVHRARHVHLPAAALAAHRHRRVRVLRTRDAAVEHDLDQRLSHSRGGMHGGAGGRVHAGECDRVRAGGDRCRARRERVRPAPLVLLQLPQRFPRGDREVPRRPAALGAHHARPVRRHEPARAAAALPHADGRQHAHRAAAGQQHRPRRRCRRWRRCSAARSRCTATAATRRCRCRRRRRRASRCGRSR